jgi:hypothetical protein
MIEWPAAMPPHACFRPVACCCLALLAAACVTTGARHDPADFRIAEDTPPQFVTEDGVAPRQECRTPLLDPRDHTRLRLVRSVPFGTSYRGDYEVPLGKYGVRESELLRIECETGQAVGIVRN